MSGDLLWLSVETPDLHGSGGQRRQYHQIRALRERGVSVVVAALAGPQDDSTVRALTPIHRFPPRRRWLGRRNASLERVIERAAPARAVVAHMESLPHVLPELRKSGIPFLVDFHNVFSRWHESLGDRAEAATWRERERRALAAADRATACSREEQAALAALGTTTPVDLCPHGVDPEEWSSSYVGNRHEPSIAMFGSWMHQPNRIAAEWLGEAVWPLVRAAVPSARLLLYGPGQPPSAVVDQDGVTACGRAGSLAEALGRVRVVVVPVTQGMGARMKFGEALASGAAVVSTSEGAEGFDADGVFIRADDAQAFAHSCVELLRHPDRARELGRRARELALTRLTWARTSTPLVRWAER